MRTIFHRSGVISASAYLTIQAGGDGVSNQDEYLAGTNPADPLSYLKIDAIRAGQPTKLEFLAASNKTYTVQFKERVNAATWSKLAEIRARSTNRIEIRTDSVSESVLRLYRLATPAIP